MLMEFTKQMDALNDDGRFKTQMSLYVTNHGTAPANNLEITVSFAANVVVQIEREVNHTFVSAASIRSGVKADIDLSVMIDSFGNRWTTLFNRDLELLPGQRPVCIGRGFFYVSPVETTVLWRIKCRQGNFPGMHSDEALPINFGS